MQASRRVNDYFPAIRASGNAADASRQYRHPAAKAAVGQKRRYRQPASVDIQNDRRASRHRLRAFQNEIGSVPGTRKRTPEHEATNRAQLVKPKRFGPIGLRLASPQRQIGTSARADINRANFHCLMLRRTFNYFILFRT